MAVEGDRGAPGLSRVLTFQDLQLLTGYRRRADVERVLTAQGITLFKGRLGPWTTIDLVNQAGGLARPGDSPGLYGPENPVDQWRGRWWRRSCAKPVLDKFGTAQYLVSDTTKPA